jgi:hypothetical protein
MTALCNFIFTCESGAEGIVSAIKQHCILSLAGFILFAYLELLIYRIWFETKDVKQLIYIYIPDGISVRIPV